MSPPPVCSPEKRIGVQPTGSQVYSSEESKLIVKKNLWSLVRDDFIVNSNGSMKFRCKRELFSPHGRKVLNDARGNQIFTLDPKEEKAQGCTTLYGKNPSGYKFRIKIPYADTWYELAVEFGGASDHNRHILCAVEHTHNILMIRMDEKSIARIEKKFSFPFTQRVSTFSIFDT